MTRQYPKRLVNKCKEWLLQYNLTVSMFCDFMIFLYFFLKEMLNKATIHLHTSNKILFFAHFFSIFSFSLKIIQVKMGGALTLSNDEAK